MCKLTFENSEQEQELYFLHNLLRRVMLMALYGFLDPEDPKLIAGYQQRCFLEWHNLSSYCCTKSFIIGCFGCSTFGRTRSELKPSTWWNCPPTRRCCVSNFGDYVMRCDCQFQGPCIHSIKKTFHLSGTIDLLYSPRLCLALHVWPHVYLSSVCEDRNRQTCLLHRLPLFNERNNYLKQSLQRHETSWKH